MIKKMALFTAWGVGLHQTDRLVAAVDATLPPEVVRVAWYTIGVVGAYLPFESLLADLPREHRPAARVAYWLAFVPIGAGVALGHALDVVAALRRK